jgi:hypothetical protein
MVRLNALRSVLFLVATWLLSSSFLWAGESIISKVSDSSGNFCHLKFPAIRNRPFIRIVQSLKIRARATLSTSTDPATMILWERRRSFAKGITIVSIGCAKCLRASDTI